MIVIQGKNKSLSKIKHTINKNHIFQDLHPEKIYVMNILIKLKIRIKVRKLKNKPLNLNALQIIAPIVKLNYHIFTQKVLLNAKIVDCYKIY